MKSAREVLSENLQELIDSKKIDQRVLAEYLNVSDSAVSQWLKGNKYPRIDKIQQMADFFNVPKSRLTEQKPNNIIELSPRFVKVPILGVIACGDPILAEENYIGYRYELKDALPSGKVFYLQAKGDSMEPTIPNGSLVMVREQPNVENGEIAAVRVNGNTEATLKRVKRQGDLVLLYPDNPKYDPIVITEGNPATIIGKAIRYTVDL